MSPENELYICLSIPSFISYFSISPPPPAESLNHTDTPAWQFQVHIAIPRFMTFSDVSILERELFNLEELRLVKQTGYMERLTIARHWGSRAPIISLNIPATASSPALIRAIFATLLYFRLASRAAISNQAEPSSHQSLTWQAEVASL